MGICLIKNSGLSFYYSMPNKMYEYIQAEIPQVASDFPEISSVVKGEETGLVTDPKSRHEVTKAINILLTDITLYNRLKINCRDKKNKFYWENVEHKLISMVKADC